LSITGGGGIGAEVRRPCPRKQVAQLPVTPSHDDGDIGEAQPLDIRGNERRSRAKAQRRESGDDCVIDVHSLQDRHPIRPARVVAASMSGHVANNAGSEPGRGALRVAKFAESFGCIGESVCAEPRGACSITKRQQERETVQRRAVELAEGGVLGLGGGGAG